MKGANKHDYLDSSYAGDWNDGDRLADCTCDCRGGWLGASPPGRTQGAKESGAANAPSDKT